MSNVLYYNHICSYLLRYVFFFRQNIFEPPPLELYTQYSLQAYFFTFWGILFLQVIAIFVSDKIWVKTIPQNSTKWERMVHAIEKSHFSFSFFNWQNGNGDCHEHLKRKNEAQCEVLLTMAINLLFNMILLIPLVILCK